MMPFRSFFGSFLRRLSTTVVFIRCTVCKFNVAVIYL